MSITRDYRRIVCDGEACTNIAQLPVALRPILSDTRNAEPPDSSSAQGWLFVSDEGYRQRHFCPNCAPQFLRYLLPRDTTQEESSIHGR